MSNQLSLGFSDFRPLLDHWDQILFQENKKKQLDELFDKHDLTLFFKKDKQIYGCPEEGRVIFAKLKAGDNLSAMMIGKKEDVKFLAYNLSKAMYGNEDEAIQTLLGKPDLKSIKVISREKAIEKLAK